MQNIRRWSELSTDPNAQVVFRARHAELQRAYQPELIPDRSEYLIQLARGRRVLDVGIVDHQVQRSMDEQTWLHGLIDRSAAYCLGVDILEPAIEQIRSRGFNVRCWDLQQAPLEEKFDLVVCGEIIEHVNSPGLLLQHIRQMLLPGGRLVLTAPNPWFLNQILKNCRRGTMPSESADHVAWFDRCTLLELGQRCGLALASYRGPRFKPVSGVRGRGLLLAQRVIYGTEKLWLALGASPSLFAASILYEFVRMDSVG